MTTFSHFHHAKDRDVSLSKSQAHTMDGIVLGRSPTSNAILVYNPRNQRYYEPDSCRINPYCLPPSVNPTIKYDGGLFVLLHRDGPPTISEPFPPGTRVLAIDPSSGRSLAEIVMDIPFDSTSSPQYLIIFDDGTTRAVSAADMPSLIPTPAPVVSDSTHLLPPFLQPGCKITYEHEGQLHKGFLGQSPDGVFRFSFKSHINKKSEDWGVPLPNLNLPGTIYASMASSSPGTNHRHSNAPACHEIPMHRNPTLALSTSIANVPDPSSPDSTPHTLIATRGWLVSARRNPASNLKTHTSRLISLTTVPFEQKGFPRRFLQFVSSPLRKTKCSTRFALNLASLFSATTKIESGLNPRSTHPSSGPT